jgi:hypothetical protein
MICEKNKKKWFSSQLSIGHLVCTNESIGNTKPEGLVTSGGNLMRARL